MTTAPRSAYSPDPQRILGHAKIEDGGIPNNRNAEQACARALQLRPDFPAAHYHAGNALAAQGRWAEAAAHYEAVLRLTPGHARAHNNLANTLVSRGQWEAAVPHYRQALALEPDNEQARQNLRALTERLRR